MTGTAPRNVPRNALRWLERQPEFRSLAARAERLLALQADLSACTSSHSLVAMGVTDDTLTVGAPNAATAAKLRQLEPSIVASLRDRGWQVKRIRFRPQPPGAYPGPPLPALKRPIPADALAEFASLSDEVDNDLLRSALARLVRRRAPRR